MFSFTCRVPTYSLTPRAYRTIPSLEPATFGPQWSLHAIPLRTTFPTRSPPHTVRRTAAREESPWNVMECLHSSSGLFFIILQNRDEEKEARKRWTATEHANFEFSPVRGRKRSPPRAPPALWPALCVCLCTSTSRETNLLKARTVYTSICLMQSKLTSSVGFILLKKQKLFQLMLFVHLTAETIDASFVKKKIGSSLRGSGLSTAPRVRLMKALAYFLNLNQLENSKRKTYRPRHSFP